MMPAIVFTGDKKNPKIHECRHAKSLKGKTIQEITTMYEELANIHIDGISDIALLDGAEIEVLLARGQSVPEKAMKFYKKYIGGVR